MTVDTIPVAFDLPWPSAGQEERHLRFLEQELRRVVSSTLATHADDIRIHVARGEAVKRILEQAQACAAGISSEALLRASPVPVLVVH